MEAKIRGYTDPRTGEYKRATEANREEVLADLGFIMAWKHYWDGPLLEDRTYLYSREEWLTSQQRQAWLDDLSEEQRTALLTSQPPEEVPPA